MSPPSRKRKTLHDFFSSQISPLSFPPGPLSSTTLSSQTRIATAVPGITIRPSFITSSEEATLLTYLSTQSWRTDLSRRIIHYGGTYCLMPPRDASPGTRSRIEKAIVTADPIPKEFTYLIQRMISVDLYTPVHKPTHIIVNEYLPTHGISAHVESFRFSSPVCALTLGDGDYLRFHELVDADDGSVRSGKAQKAIRTERKVNVWVPRRSLLVMEGEGRWRWQHEVVRGSKKWRGDGWKRTSLTFRVEAREVGRGEGLVE